MSKRTIAKGILWLLLISAVMICGILFQRRVEERHKYEELREMSKQAAAEVEEEPKIEEPSLEEPKRRIDFEALREENSDIYAWIEVPGTKVDYPIVQHPEDRLYYLDHTIGHEKGLPGSIYTEGLNSKDFSDGITVIYGHNMKDDSMFGSLHDYEEEAFFEEHSKVYIYTPTHQYTYEITAAVIFDNRYIPNAYDYQTSEGAHRFLEDLEEYPGHFRTELMSGEDMQVITLSTCIGNLNDRRYEVVAVLQQVMQYAE